MRIVKLKPREIDFFTIEREVFEQKTGKKPPYYPDTTNPENGPQYAVCPACDNPAQLIGLYRINKQTPYPYAKHHTQSLAGIAQYIQENYEHCPFQRQALVCATEAKRALTDPLARAIIEQMIKHFDKWIYFLQKETGIFISETLAETLLRGYLAAGGFLYYDATLMNMPLMLLHGVGRYRLNGRVILDKSLKQALSKIPQLVFEGDKVGCPRDMNITWCFMFYKNSLMDGKTVDSMLFTVDYQYRNNEELHNIYKKTITLSSDDIQRLMTYDDSLLPEKTRERNQRLQSLALSIAMENGLVSSGKNRSK